MTSVEQYTTTIEEFQPLARFFWFIRVFREEDRGYGDPLYSEGAGGEERGETR